MRRIIWSWCFEDCIHSVQGSDLGRCCEAEKLQELEGWRWYSILQALWHGIKRSIFCGAGDACPERARGPKASERQGLRTLTEGWTKINREYVLIFYSFHSLPGMSYPFCQHSPGMAPPAGVTSGSSGWALLGRLAATSLFHFSSRFYGFLPVQNDYRGWDGMASKSPNPEWDEQVLNFRVVKQLKGSYCEFWVRKSHGHFLELNLCTWAIETSRVLPDVGPIPRSSSGHLRVPPGNQWDAEASRRSCGR